MSDLCQENIKSNPNSISVRLPPIVNNNNSSSACSAYKKPLAKCRRGDQLNVLWLATVL